MKAILLLLYAALMLAALALPGATPPEGGLPVVFQGHVIGAIEVSGNTPQVEAIARVGMAAAAGAIDAAH